MPVGASDDEVGVLLLSDVVQPGCILADRPACEGFGDDAMPLEPANDILDMRAGPFVVSHVRSSRLPPIRQIRTPRRSEGIPSGFLHRFYPLGLIDAVESTSSSGP